MNNYIKEIVEICKLPFGEIEKDYKVICISNKCLYLCNYKKLIDYNSEKIVARCKNNIIEVSGENLELIQINKGEVVIRGKIKLVNLGD